jgi:hypothetical protein
LPIDHHPPRRQNLLTERLTDVTPEQIVEGIVGQQVEGMAHQGATSAEPETCSG